MSSRETNRALTWVCTFWRLRALSAVCTAHCCADLDNGLIAAATAGLTNGITFDSGTGSFGFNVNAPVAGVTAPSLASLAGVQNAGNALVPQAGAAAATSVPAEALAIAGEATVQAKVQTVIGGGSFLNDLKDDATGDLAAAGAYAIGNATAAQPYVAP